MTELSSALIYLGSALMLLNIVRYILLERVVLRSNYWDKGRGPLHIPLALLVLFLLGYLAVGYVGTHDNVVPSILFGGSLFVFLILSLMKIVLKKVEEGEERIGAVHKDLNAEKKADNLTLVPEAERTKEENALFSYGYTYDNKYLYHTIFLMPWIPDESAAAE